MHLFVSLMMSDMRSINLNSQETITSASSIGHGITSELLDGQRKLLSLVTSGNPLPQSTGALQPDNGSVANLLEVLDTLNFHFTSFLV
jgi:hypothetical protein